MIVVVEQVDGIVLSGFTNQQAVEILKQTGQVVKLRITRYLRGLKFQELQEGIAIANAETPNTNSPYLLTPNESKMTGFENQVASRIIVKLLLLIWSNLNKRIGPKIDDHEEIIHLREILFFSYF